jgi:hypothetical protein
MLNPVPMPHDSCTDKCKFYRKYHLPSKGEGPVLYETLNMRRGKRGSWDERTIKR